jgi:hypothetical protein
LAESCHPDLTIGLMVLLNVITLQLQQPLPEPNPIDRARGDLAERDDGGLSPSGDTSRCFPAVQRGGVRCSMQHDLEQLCTTPSQSMVVVGVGRPPVCRPPPKAAGRSGEAETDRDRL